MDSWAGERPRAGLGGGLQLLKAVQRQHEHREGKRASTSCRCWSCYLLKHTAQQQEREFTSHLATSSQDLSWLFTLWSWPNCAQCPANEIQATFAKLNSFLPWKVPEFRENRLISTHCLCQNFLHSLKLQPSNESMGKSDEQRNQTLTIETLMVCKPLFFFFKKKSSF